QEWWRVDEGRLAELRVPPTLTGVLQARLDSLPPEQRTILQQAAVVGSTFWDRVVARIGQGARPAPAPLGPPRSSSSSSAQSPGDHRPRESGDAVDERGQGELEEALWAPLSALRSRELVAQRETSAFAGSQEFVFKHAALRQVAYDSILKKIRRGYHSLVADWLIEQSQERAGEHMGLVAEHLELAGRTEEALEYLRSAGDRAAARFANAEAT